MKSTFSLIILLFLVTSCKNEQKQEIISSNDDDVKEVTFITADSIKIFGDLYLKEKTAPTILLFHQGGSNAKAEYGSIIPVLRNEGYNILSIDQRLGGQIYGMYNKTVANIKNNEYSYCDAYPDLEGALNFILKSGFTGKKIVWGSSYSGSLAVKLGKHYSSDIDAVLAFSPASGGPMQECKADIYFEEISIPLLLLRPSTEMERASSKNQFDFALKNKHQTYIAKNGVHGSSMLVKDRVKHDVNDNWKIVKSFLEEVSNN